MMSKEELLKQLERAMGKSTVLKLAALSSQSTNLIRDLIDLSFYPEKVIAFRASWILENIFLEWKDLFWDELPLFFVKYPLQSNDSCRRHFTKIMMEITKRRQDVETAEWEPVIEATFGWLVDPASPVAVQANCIDILFNLRDEDDWIGSELKAQVQFLLKNGTAAIQARGKKILGKLNKEING